MTAHSRLLKAVDAAPAAPRLSAPALLALQAFDAAARLGSFKAAADELHLTPSAISHRIRNLERLVGTRLFTRNQRTVVPNEAGRALAAATGHAFRLLARAALPADAPGTKSRLNLAATPSFASSWLIPHLAEFMAAHPAIELAIENVSRTIDFETDAFDAAITVGTEDWPGLDAARLMEIFTTPICTQALATQLHPIRPGDLAGAPLISVSTYPRAWPVWCARAGIEPFNPARSIWVDTFAAAQQAAEQGAGVALGIEPLFADRERAGALVRPIAIRASTGSLWLVHRPADRGRPALRAFKTWVLSLTAAGR